MKMNKINILSLLVAAVMSLASCGSVKDIAYFQNKAVDNPEMIDKHA